MRHASAGERKVDFVMRATRLLAAGLLLGCGIYSNAFAANPDAADSQQTPKVAAFDHLVYLPVAAYLQANAKTSFAGFDAADREVLQQFYGERSGSALWVDKNGYTDDAKNLFAALKDADNWGLRSTDYKIPDLKPAADGGYSVDDLTNAETRLSLAAMEYARDARGGRISDPSAQLGSYIDRKPQLVGGRTVIDSLAAAPDKGDYLRSLQPKQPQFERLRQKLLALRVSAKGAETTKIADGPLLMPGKSHPQIALIRKVLKVSSPSVEADGSPADDTYYDDGLARAVEDYKQKKGISPATAAITTTLRRTLNSSNDISEWKILANMEEWRWMPEDLGKFHVIVNIPEFKVRVIKDGEVVHEERIVTGRVDTQTPIFSDMMRSIVFQPRWIVPDSIKIKELLPGLRAGGDPLRRQGLVMERNGRKISAWNVDWYRTDIRYFDIYQPPGGSNALGVVKFLFPNRHAVYLHDTPSKGLFNENVRAFSHGCMRVRNPVKLADIVLNEDKGWDKSKIDDLVSKGPEQNEIALTNPIPVHVAYFTAWVGDNGDVETFNDVYGHEKRITLALQGRWNQIVKADERKVSPDDIGIDDDNWFSADSRSRDDEDDDDYGGRRRHRNHGGFGNFLQQVFGGN
jgi:murein L,D-transpeptidase YcbB/YkuD